LEVEFVFDSFNDRVDWFGPDVGISNAKVDCSPLVAFVVGMVLSLFKNFGFFVVL